MCFPFFPSETAAVQRQTLTWIVLCLVALMVGCTQGDDMGLVRAKGTVLYNGQPVAGANVTFAHIDGHLATGTTDAQGVFTLTTNGRPGAMLGDHKVGISKFENNMPDTSQLKPEDMMRMQQEGGGSAAYEPKALLPIKYSMPTDSGLSATVVEDESQNTFEFPLVD
jgi:hypothetical protein